MPVIPSPRKGIGASPGSLGLNRSDPFRTRWTLVGEPTTSGTRPCVSPPIEPRAGPHRCADHDGNPAEVAESIGVSVRISTDT